VIRPGGPLYRITDFADSHLLLAVYSTVQQARTGGSPEALAPTQRPGHDHLIAVS